MTDFFTRGGIRSPESRRGLVPMIGVVTAILLAVAGCSPSNAVTDSDVGEATAVAAQPVLPTPTDTGPTRQAAAQLPAVPADGTVTIEEGAFTDRLDINGLALEQGQRPSVTAQLGNAVDVSDLIVLELQADFYDASGRFLGSGTATYADEEFADTGATSLRHGTGQHDEAFEVNVRSDRQLPGAKSAILTVPQLVNE